MPETATATGRTPLPVVSFVKIPETGSPYLEGQRCGECKAVFLDERSTCSSCGARGKLKAEKLSERGTLYVYSIVYRSFPGVKVPYISAIVDLEGGGTVKGNLVGIDPDPAKLKLGMAVRTIFEIAPTKDREGNEYLTYYFTPAA
jgi:uncharacterized protein